MRPSYKALWLTHKAPGASWVSHLDIWRVLHARRDIPAFPEGGGWDQAQAGHLARRISAGAHG